MNFLAHQFLSFHQKDLQIGNLYGEIVRVKDYLKFPEGIKKGILLHRSIDSFTDTNEIVKESTVLFHPKYGKYAPVIVDVLYDYFLIKNWQLYTNQPFESFVGDCYSLFKTEFDGFDPKLKFIVKHLLEYDWFHNYSNYDGIRETLKGISHRSKFENNIDEAVVEMRLYENELNEHFKLFFPKIIEHCKLFIENES